MLYFAYGSNMDRATMARRCPASRPVGLGRLQGHRLVIMREGYASVLRDPRAVVHGLVWDLALADVPPLDRYEGVSGGLYVKAQVPILTERGARRALVYLGTDAGPGLPRPGYLEGILAAARELGLAERYLAEIAALGPLARGVAPPSRQPVPRVRPVRASPHGAPLGPAERIGRWEP